MEAMEDGGYGGRRLQREDERLGRDMNDYGGWRLQGRRQMAGHKKGLYNAFRVWVILQSASYCI